MSTNRIWGCFYAFLFFVTCMTCAYINGQTSMRVKMHRMENEIAILHGDFQAALEESQSFVPAALPRKPSRWDAVDLNN